jgi:2-polyprenyl-6-methoxyphenol hydroxylase-like FAD-dependent oxidoreductase
MKAVICGAGIAGLALAARLAQGGWQVTVLESAPALHNEGYVVDLFGSGFEAARRMSLMPALRRVSYEFEAVRWVNASGRTSARLPYRVILNLMNGTLISLLRGDLQRAVLEQLPSTVEVRFNQWVSQVRAPVGAVEVHLQNGDVERGDVVIGADGIHSRVRDLVFGDGASWSRFLGFHTAAFILDSPELDDELKNQLHIVSVPGRQVMLYPLRDGQVAATFVRRAAQGAHPRSPHDALVEAFGDLDWRVPFVLEQAGSLPSVAYEQVGQVVIAHWTRGRIALLGDACQAVTLLPGQGASLSLAAAFVLGEELLRNDDVKAALVRYEHRVRPPLIHMRRAGRRTADWLVPSTSTRLMARNAMLRLASRPGLARLLRPVVDAAREDVLTSAAENALRVPGKSGAR